MSRNQRPKKSKGLQKGWCAACNKFSGHFPDACPRRPLAYKIEIYARGEYKPVGEEPEADEYLELVLPPA